jgi:hypothetical protein
MDMQQFTGTETLQGLLETQLHRPIAPEEAADIGNSLLAFYEILGAEAGADEQ